MKKYELIVEIHERHQTRSLGYFDAKGQRVPQVGAVGNALKAAAEKAENQEQNQSK